MNRIQLLDFDIVFANDRLLFLNLLVVALDLRCVTVIGIAK